MSALRNALSSVGGGAASDPPSSTNKATQNTTQSGRPTNDAPTAPKRKADDSTGVGPNKAPRLIPKSQPASSSTPLTAKLPSDTPYRGTAQRPSLSANTQKPLSKPIPATPRPPPAASISRPKYAPTVPAPTPTAAPTKGSYADLMARAKANQTSAPVMGIKHKPVEPVMSRAERLKKIAESKKPGFSAKGSKSGSKSGSRNISRDASPMKGGDQKKGKDKKEKEPTGYRGTMRPSSSEPAYKGTMGGALAMHAKRTGPANTSRNSKTDSTAKKKQEPKGRYGGYVSWSDLDDAEEDEEDYESESDMEAGFHDVGREERLAEAAAKKEDEQATREEDELKRQKQEKKDRLAKLAAAQEAKKKRY
ncbi:hypothetical protein K402DRAFT_459294 [Aulographum hederae CBS 113979]|uniref:SPT2-domain-containing protein n=1 Tax=Aulographum hederae CBS 113979 TaxID=1176131 RepID=A0A6G1HGP4_9PEZI|nr:hypothetical protein K402DRAFT_459294 [Aulographum hederae CBS 113979]